MRLRRVEIRGFKSVPNRLTLHVRPTLTCLIGANEHGKSNILDALRRLNSPQFDEFDRYSHANNPNYPRITYIFELSAKERVKLVEVLRSDVKRHQATLATLKADSNTAPEKIAKTQNSLKWNESSLAHYLKEENREFSIELRHDDTLRLELAHITYSFSQAPNWPIYLGSALPEVRLFSASDELADTITLDDLNDRVNLPYEGLLKLAGKWADREKLFGEDIVAERHLVEAGKTLTRKLRGIWSQGARHTFRLSASSGRLRLSIEDPTTLDTPSRRSLGFRSFLALALTLYAETDSLNPEGYILLFDEPGIHLHPQGQKDLLRELRRLSMHNQIIYTTHSPFMIDRNDLDATILVRKETVGKDKGTRLTYRPYGANWSALSAALGVSPADAFFPPDRSLLVEGTSDRVYIARYMSLCAPALRADLNFLNIIDADRREEMEAVARILVSAGRELVVVSDADEGGKDWQKWIRRIAGAKRNQIDFLDIRPLTRLSKPVSIEDLLPLPLWFDAVRMWLTEVLSSDHEIDEDAVKARAESQTLGRAMAEYLVAAQVIMRAKDFSKTNVADFFSRGTVPVPVKGESMFELCSEITRRLGLIRL